MLQLMADAVQNVNTGTSLDFLPFVIAGGLLLVCVIVAIVASQNAKKKKKNKKKKPQDHIAQKKD